MNKMSPQEKNKLHWKLYNAYVDNLRTTGEKFPENQFGRVNVNKVAEDCGIDRQVFDRKRGKKFFDTLLADAREIGTATNKPRKTDEFLSTKFTEHQNIIGSLEKENALLNEKINALEKQVMVREAEIIRLNNLKDEKEESFEQMLQTGRRFTL